MTTPAPGSRTVTHSARTCVGCGVAMTGRQQRRYCSLACMGRSRRAAVVRCPCGTEVSRTRSSVGRRRKYCSRTCYARSLLAPPTTITCERCKREVTRDRQGGHELRRRKQRYCSLACANADQGCSMEERTGRVLRALRRSGRVAT